MNDFDGRPFVAGSIVGLRAFDVDALGRLTGVTHKEVFKPGVNEAECMGNNQIITGLPAGSELRQEWDSPRMWSQGGYIQPYGGQEVRWHLRLPSGDERTYASLEAIAKDFPPPAESGHRVGQAGCTCGFYGYFDGTNKYASDGCVQAVIEGTGLVSVGARGFRAEKARLLALIDPTGASPVDQTKRWAWRAGAAFRWIALVLNAIGLPLNVVQQDWVWAGVNAVALGLMIWLTVHAWKQRPSVAQLLDELSGSPWDRVRRNYSDVPTYPTVKAALAEFPLTPPPLPGPEDDEFWTMKAPA